jgi:integrase
VAEFAPGFLDDRVGQYRGGDGGHDGALDKIRRAGVHVLRHSAAKLRRDAGESIESVSQFLDHSSLAVTSVYLRRLDGVEDRAWREVADAIGV